MASVTIETAETHFSHLLQCVEAGEEIVITRGDTPVARLVPIVPAVPSGRVFGAARGLYAAVPRDAFAPLDDDELISWE